MTRVVRVLALRDQLIAITRMVVSVDALHQAHPAMPMTPVRAHTQRIPPKNTPTEPALVSCAVTSLRRRAALSISLDTARWTTTLAGEVQAPGHVALPQCSGHATHPRRRRQPARGGLVDLLVQRHGRRLNWNCQAGLAVHLDRGYEVAHSTP